MNKKRSLARHCELLERAAKRRQHTNYLEIALAAKYNCPLSTIRFCRNSARSFHLSQSDAARVALARFKKSQGSFIAPRWNKIFSFIFRLSPEQWAELTALHRVDYGDAVLQ